MIRISPVPTEAAPKWTTEDRSLLVDHVGVPKIEGGRLFVDPVPVAPYRKTYALDAPDESERYVAYLGTESVGELRCAKGWNNYLHVHDLVVGASYRRRGIGEALVRHALTRANELGLVGVALETQNTNCPALRLYERCGFELGGFDQLLYKALDPSSQEVALFLYASHR